ncbi:hypothetical protein J4221_07530 [Candidatus Pacearchaeota archaeon]|nr:hypothetical protein [Candidatus Pacearchaeota archaeon]
MVGGIIFNALEIFSKSTGEDITKKDESKKKLQAKSKKTKILIVSENNILRRKKLFIIQKIEKIKTFKYNGFNIIVYFLQDKGGERNGS